MQRAMAGMGGGGGMPGMPGMAPGGMGGMPGMPGSAPAPAPATTSAPAPAPAPEPTVDELRAKYGEQLTQLRDMGLDDEEQCLRALHRSQGNVQFAINRIMGDM